MLQNVIKTWKTRKNRKDTRWGVFFALAISESMFFRAHFASNLDAFCINFACFLTLSPSKVRPGTAKMNAFCRIWTRHGLGCLFGHCKIGIHVFSCSFCGDFGCILAWFCMILGSRLEAWSRSMNGPRSRSKRVIFITFSSVFDTPKIKLTPTFCGFPEKWGQNLDAEKWTNFGPSIFLEAVFWTFSASRPKTWSPRQKVSKSNII